MIRQNEKILHTTQKVLDFFTAVFAMGLASWLETLLLSEEPFTLFRYSRPVTAGAYVLIGLLHVAVCRMTGIYRSYRGRPFGELASGVLKANLISWGILAAFFYWMAILTQVRAAVTLFFFVNSALQLLLRRILYRLLRWLRRRGYNRKYLLFLGWNSCAPRLAEKMQAAPESGYEILGYLDWQNHPETPLSYLGKPSELETYLKGALVDQAFLLCREESPPGKEWEVLAKFGIPCAIVPNLFANLPSRAFLSDFAGLPVLRLRQFPLDDPVKGLCKRAFDIGVSLFCLLVFSPILLAAAIGVKVSSPGPVIFRQVRVGANRRTFVMYKFRSMRVETESVVKMAAAAGDSRCTRVGAFLRKYSIDELPQLVNVLKGDMSLVGPRPEIPAFVERFMESIPSYMWKHAVRPGITGWAQIHGLRGGGTSISKRIQYDMAYLENWSFWLDIKILFRTAFRLRADLPPTAGKGERE